MEAYHKALGWGPWNVYEHKPPALHDTHLHGREQDYTMLGAETHVGPIVVELLQPVEGPSIYKEWLETRAKGCTTSPVWPTRRKNRTRSSSASPTWAPE